VKADEQKMISKKCADLSRAVVQSALRPNQKVAQNGSGLVTMAKSQQHF
jgi:hypothetical protein